MKRAKINGADKQNLKGIQRILKEVHGIMMEKKIIKSYWRS